MATKKILKKIIKNWVEYYLPEWWWGWSIDKGAVDTQIDLKLNDYDSIFRITDWLYKILNDIDTEDELGLTAWDSWSDIVSTVASMNKISHSWAVMTMIASSEEALTTAINNSWALNELLSAWNSVDNLRSSELARNIMLNDEEVVLAILNNPVAFDWYFLDKEYCKIILANKSYSVSFWGEVIDNDNFMDYLYANNDLFGVFLNNNKAFTAYKNSNYWDEALNDYNRFTIIMEEVWNKVMKTTSSEQLSQDVPLRAIISSWRLDEFLEKDERAYNGVICFDIDFKNTSYRTFSISKYWYNWVQSNWKISVDWGAWTTYNATCNTSPIGVSVSSIGRHLIVIKPETYGVGWARQMWNRNSNNYWSSTTYIAWTIKNLPIFAFMNSLTETTNSILYYAFYWSSSLVKIESIKWPSNWPENTWSDFMSDAFHNCYYLESIEGWNFLWSCYTTIWNSFLYSAFSSCSNLLYCRASIKSSSITSVWNGLLRWWFSSASKILETIPIELPECLTVWTQFMYQCYQSDTKLEKANKIIFGKLTTIWTYFMFNAFYGCNQLRNMPKWLNLETVTTIWAYFLQQTWYNCSSLLWCNPEFQMPTWYNSNTYCYYTWYYCSKLTTSAPNKNIRFRWSWSSTFSSSWTWYGNVWDWNYTLHTYSEE